MSSPCPIHLRRDRAAERRKLDDTDVTAVGDYSAVPAHPNLNNISIEESKFLGGDLEHTHLVKGLDFALLQKVQSHLVKFGWPSVHLVLRFAAGPCKPCSAFAGLLAAGQGRREGSRGRAGRGGRSPKEGSKAAGGAIIALNCGLLRQY